MASFLKSIAERLSGIKGAGAVETIQVAAFGKHPGWNDHIEGIGLETDLLVAAKRLIYVQGIGENIDQGAWEKLRPDQRLDGFRHSFLWHRPPEVVAGRLWSSEDGRGRKSYPMVVCAHCRGPSLDWVAGRLLPRFEALEAQCRLSRTAAEVRAQLTAFQTACRASVEVENDQGRTPPAGVAQTLGRIAALSGVSSTDERLMRILYHLDREVGAHRDEKGGSTNRALLRVAVPAGQAVEAAVLWLTFLAARLGRSVDALAFMPCGETWIDLVVGEPTARQLYCLRAATGAVPLTSDIPYNIDPAFKERARGLLSS